jgi:hypothetical protein
MWGAVADERTGMSFTIATGPRQRSAKWLYRRVQLRIVSNKSFAIVVDVFIDPLLSNGRLLCLHYSGFQASCQYQYNETKE